MTLEEALRVSARPTKTTPVTEADSPFDDADADVVLRSSDNVDFKVFRLFLSFGSPFFKDLFSLPQSVGNNSETRGGLPVVPVSETARTLRMLLSMCYPMGAVDPPALDKPDDVAMLLDAAIKYGLERVEKRAREALIAPPCMHGNEVRVFAIACHHKMDAEAKAAARATLEQPVADLESGPELELISAAKFFLVLEYHKACIKAAREAARKFAPHATIWQSCPKCSRYGQKEFKPVASVGTPTSALTLLNAGGFPNSAEIEKVMEASLKGSLQIRCSCS
ncbi:hypothetical protein HWV62_39926 [Athelia sp. TMB]|nr:hypothetical protein HWV62_39926 [Athelia sp. TMB]